MRPLRLAPRGLAWRVVPLVAVVLALAAIDAERASADVTVRVSTVQDQVVLDGKCSLPEAVAYVAGQTQPDCTTESPNGTVTISIPAGCYRLAGGLGLAFPANSLITTVAFAGAGAGPAGCGGGGTVIDAMQAGRVLTLYPPIPVELSGMTVTGGRPCGGVGGCSGGGIYNLGRLLLDGVTVTSNVAGAGDDQTTPGTGATGGTGGTGGGIYNGSTGQLTMTRSAIVGNAAGNGGAGADGSGNGGGMGGDGGNGGAIYNDGGCW